MTIQIRDARPENADAEAATITRILIRTKQESFAGPLDPHDLDAEFWRARWQHYIKHGSGAQQATGDGFVLLAEAAGEVIGFAAYHHTRRWNCDAELQSLYVLRSRQRKGLGSTLLREVADRLRAEGSRRLCVGYAPDNPYKRFYRKHGAVEINPHWAVWRSLPSIEVAREAAL